MAVQFTLLSIADPKKKRLLARRIAQNPNVTIAEVLLHLDRLPAVIFRSIGYEEAVAMQDALKRMGCESEVKTVFVPPQPPSPKQEKAEEPPKEGLPETRQYGPLVTPLEDRWPLRRFEGPKPPRTVPRQSRFRREWSYAGVAVLLLGLIVIGQRYFAGQGPQATGARVEKKRLRKALRDAEERLQEDDTDSGAVEQAVQAYGRAAAASQSPAEKIRHLTRAIRLKSDDISIRGQMSRAYADTAQRVFGADARIRFYRMALSFNQYNEEAWNGLASAYQEAGREAEARQAEQRRDSVFSERNNRFAEIVGLYGTLARTPRTRDNVLHLAYRTRTQRPDFVFQEVFEILRELRQASTASLVKVTVLRGSQELLSIVSPREHLPKSFAEWREKIKIEANTDSP